MAHHGSGLDPPGPPHLRQPVLHGKERRLCPYGFVNQRTIAGLRPLHGGQRPAGRVGPEQGVAAIDDLSKYW
jgi:hypothetical protein